MKNNQPKSNKGGKRVGAGRPKGKPNKATADVQELARQYGPEAVDMLWSFAKDAKASDSARVGALKEILDRAYGKAKQTTDTQISGALTVAFNNHYAS